MSSSRRAPLEALYPVIAEKIAAGGRASIPVTGTSMLPFLVEGRDKVELAAAPEKLRVGDVLLYRRAGGEFVLHRVAAVRRGGYAMCGDNQYALEYPVLRCDIVAVMSGVWRGSDYIPADDAEYIKYSRRRLRSRALRGLFARLRRVRRMLFGEK